MPGAAGAAATTTTAAAGVCVVVLLLERCGVGLLCRRCVRVRVRVRVAAGRRGRVAAVNCAHELLDDEEDGDARQHPTCRR
jgi:hypothetical protein